MYLQLIIIPIHVYAQRSFWTINLDSRTKIDVFRDFAYGKSLDEEESSCASKTYNIMKKISSEEAGARSTEDELKPSLPKAKSDHRRVPIQMKLLS